MIEVYYAAPSIFGRKVLAVLEEKGLDYEIKPMSFAAKDHLKEDYLQINPNGEVPAIVDDGAVIYESTAIIEYLNDEYPEPPLLPEDSFGRAQVRMIDDYCDLHFYKALVHCLIKNKFDKQPLEAEDLQKVSDGLKRLETYLGKQEYIAGKFSLADCAAMAGLATLEGLGLTEQAKPFGTLQKYWQRVKGRQGYKGANLLSLPEAASKNA